MTIDFILLMLSGSLVVFAIGQLFVQRRTSVNIMLSLLIMTCFLWIAHAIGFRLGMLDVYPHLNKLHVPFLAATGPLWYLYVRMLVTGESWKAEDKWHFLPVTLSVILMTPFLFQPDTFKREYVEVEVTGFVTLSIYLATRTAEISTVIYPAIALQKICYSENWRSRLILIGLSIAAVIAAGFRLIGSISGDHTVSVFIPIIVMIPAFIAFYCLSQRYPYLLGQKIPTSRSKFISHEGVARLDSFRERIQRNNWHLNANLKIQDLARRLGVPAHDLSEIINKESDGNFNTFINALRIEHAKKRLRSGDQSIINIAHDSGFNSQSVFYEQFKRFESLSPAQYRKTELKKRKNDSEIISDGVIPDKPFS